LHSLRYLHMAVSEPGLGIPQYLVMGYLDGIPFMRYDSERGRVEPLTQAGMGLPGAGTQFHGSLSNLPAGLHTVQWDYGCELLSDGNVRGSDRYGYDGQDFISFDLGSGSFVAADRAAQVTKMRWDAEGFVAEHLTNYLGQTCVDELRRFVGYGRKALERK
ncbi:HMR1 protein, partial [Ptilonorhynchus violaceus]|nr:HMR1 protein [Ptilonorhynchus violaceus]